MKNFKLKFINFKTKIEYSLSPKNFWNKRGGKTYIHFDSVVFEKKKQIQEKFLKHLNSIEWNSLIELGCGYGFNLKYLEEKYPTKLLNGVDFSLKQISAKICQTELFEGDIARTKFLDNSYDVVLISNVLMHIPFNEIEKVKTEIFRISKEYVLLTETTNFEKIDSTDSNNYVFYHDYFKLFERDFDFIKNYYIDSIEPQQKQIIFLLKKKVC